MSARNRRSPRCKQPAVAPRLERGRVYRTEYTWQETQCGRMGPPWLNGAKPCSKKPNCGCSDYERLRVLSEEAVKRANLYYVSGPMVDDTITPKRALRLIRPYMPHLKTPRDLFLAAAWQPFKVLFERGCVYYKDNKLLLWAKARAAGKLAPWEAADITRPTVTEKRLQKNPPRAA